MKLHNSQEEQHIQNQIAHTEQTVNMQIRVEPCLKSSFPKHVKRHSRKRASNANAKFKDCVLVRSFSHMCICVHVHIFMKSSFPKHDLQT